MIDASKPMTLPAQKVGTFSQSVAPTAGFSAYTWTGRPIANHPYETPVLYHRGSWRGFNGGDPLTDLNTMSDPFKSGTTMTFVQYGNSFVSSGRNPRTPTAILYNMELYPGPGSAGANNKSNASTFVAATYNTAYAGVNTQLSTLSTTLEAANACTCPIYTQQTNSQFMILPFLGETTVSITPGGGGANVTTVTFDETHFEGGNLLVIYAAYANTGNDSACDYVRLSGGVANERTNLTAHNLESLGRCYTKFKNFKCIVYVRRQYVSAGAGGPANEQASYDAVGPILFGLSVDHAAYNVELKGPYEYNEDISSIYTADVSAWLATL